MMTRGFVEAQPLARWLHIQPREMFTLILISPIISVTRHTVGKQITDCEGLDCEYCLRRFPRRMRYFMLVLCDSERRLLELGERQADCIKFLQSENPIGQEFQVHKNGSATNSPIDAVPTLKRYDVQGVDYDELEQLVHLSGNWKPLSRTKVRVSSNGQLEPVTF